MSNTRRFSVVYKRELTRRRRFEYAHADSARAFCARLRDGTRPDLAPLEWVRLETYVLTDTEEL